MKNNLDINKITAEVITDLAKSTAQTLYKKTLNYVTDIQKKEEVDFGYAYENYLKYAKTIHEKIKTLLYRHAAKDIYSFYECVGLTRNDEIIDKVLEYIGIARQKRVVEVNFDSMDFLIDLTNSVCMLIHDGLEYRFSHRSFQEYFAALYTVQLDDEQQKKFLKLWLQDDDYRTTSFYLDMLYELETSRFVKNVIIPGIRELQELFEKNGKREEWLITYLYNDVCIREEPNGEKKCMLSVKDSYYHDMIWRACNIGGMYKNVQEERKQRAIVSKDKLVEIIEEEFGLNRLVKFEEIMQKGYAKEVVQYLYWARERYEFAVNYIDSISVKYLTDEKDFASMLEEL